MEQLYQQAPCIKHLSVHLHRTQHILTAEV